MTAYDDYIKGICFYSGYHVPCVSYDTGIDYLKRAANAGEDKAKKILNSNNILYYALLEGTILGIETSYLKLNDRSLGISYKDVIPNSDIPIFDKAIKHFSRKNISPNITVDDYLEFGIRYYVGDMTGRRNKTKGNEWLVKASSVGNKTAKKILTSFHIEEYANIEAVLRYGSVRALKKVTKLHDMGVFPIQDSELVEFAKTVIRMGNNP